MHKVLVVDDDLTCRIMYEVFFDEHETLSASNGIEALKILEKEEGIDLVVTDYQMPEMDGGILIGKLKELYPNISIILISGSVKTSSSDQ